MKNPKARPRKYPVASFRLSQAELDAAKSLDLSISEICQKALRDAIYEGMLKKRGAK